MNGGAAGAPHPLRALSESGNTRRKSEHGVGQHVGASQETRWRDSGNTLARVRKHIGASQATRWRQSQATRWRGSQATRWRESQETRWRESWTRWSGGGPVEGGNLGFRV